ncbi:uncharacterized protein conserved in bacteria [Bellilinea caldifistulae]|uniref:Uncharacterized protein n=1 Tax=Bellilinea caldifistulae TaxID=360411 RepID=A0A0N8GMZ8_9CHLR|nr:L,D-transpeptidase family protein [Bellilinea caldifistulae]KPL76698.1 hypothetical protein AC812_05140 [Bellilinea caldifistulae]GAP08885.1 uncharacterized protein conserved in bacteria [Bellilinea caldifistulae]
MGHSPRSSSLVRWQPRWAVWALSVLALLLLAGWGLFGVYLIFRFGGPVAPRVMVGETAIGGLSEAQAAARIDQQWNRERVWLVTDGQRYWQAKPLDFGVWVDPAATAKQAYQVGRGERRWQELAEVIFDRRPLQVSPVVVVSPRLAVEQLRNWRGLVERPPQPPALRYDNGGWAAAPGEAGLALDVEATVRWLEQNAALAVRSGVLTLVTRPVPSSTAALEARLPELLTQLNRPLRVEGYDPILDKREVWDVPPAQLAEWVRVEWQDDEPRLRLDEGAFPAYLDGLQSRLTDGRTVWLPPDPYNLSERWASGTPYTVILRHPPTTYTVQPGDTLLSISYRVQIPAWMILRANPGLNPDVLPSGSTLTIPSRSDLLPLPVVVGKRILIFISAQRMTVFENDQPIREFIISTGIDRSPTQPGVFQVQSHVQEAYASVWDLTMPYFLGIYEAWPGFMNGIHGLPTLSGGRRLWAGSLGRPVSYGCIILDLPAAEWLYNWAQNGVVVEIRQ